MLKGNGVLGEDEVAQLCVRVRVCAHEEQADLTLTSCETDLLRQGGGSHEAVGLSSFAYGRAGENAAQLPKGHTIGKERQRETEGAGLTHQAQSETD
ncbi:uncharacterized protein UHO2_06910 [Ustilago hordei]|uniref:Uncharacterized protein n=1 Tax=Ustilago hordei TaxID=120017 RepID=I2FRU2_USTHO|nr:uncharacterized protein UHO2_06910 [Ustilago hordei]CCF49635.1 uncharacterized protein UHOR_03141 [Ustilago hordei]SYW87065.1 related to KOG1 - Subunit of TORC1, a rapamycin-sensitive complex involved in growth control [Ustilago hordei]